MNVYITTRMNNYTLTPKHFNSVERALCEALGNVEILPPPPYYKELKLFPGKKMTEVVGALMDTIRELSVVCICLKFRPHFKDRLNEVIEEHKVRLNSNRDEYTELSVIGLFKAIRSINYQIDPKPLRELRALTEQEEGALSFMKKAVNSLAINYITLLPVYEAENWEIK